MPVVFQTKVGQVVRLDDPAVQCEASFRLDDPKLTLSSEASIVTRVVLNQQVNIQFLHTLGALIYVYAFGDRVGSLSLSGLSFCSVCDGTGQLNTAQGADAIYAWYKRHRASKRQKPVQLTIGTHVVEGFVTGFSEDVVDPAVNMVQWGVNMVTLPED